MSTEHQVRYQAGTVGRDAEATCVCGWAQSFASPSAAYRGSLEHLGFDPAEYERAIDLVGELADVGVSVDYSDDEPRRLQVRFAEGHGWTPWRRRELVDAVTAAVWAKRGEILGSPAPTGPGS